MKTAQELEDLARVIDRISDKHWDMCEHVHNPCEAAVCLKCGQVIYSCQPEWAERQCPCDDDHQ